MFRLETKDREEKIEKGMSEKIVKIALLVLLLLAVIAFFLVDFLFGGFPAAGGVPFAIGSLSEEVLLAEFSAENPSSFYPAGDEGYFAVSKDGVQYYSDGHKEMAAMSLNMVQPVIVSEGRVICIYEHKGSLVSMFSDTGELYTLQLEFPVLNVAVNSVGYAAVITQGSDVYNLYAYNEKGALITTGLGQEANVFPIATDISDDGTLWAISYLDINGVHMNSKITYVSLLAADSLDYRDGIVASNADNPDELIAHIQFMEDNRLLAISDKKIGCFDTQALFKQVWSIDLKNQLDFISFDGKTGFAVALGDPLLNTNADKPGLIRYYSMDGTVRWFYQGTGSSSFLNARYGAAIVGEGRSYSALNDRGELLGRFSAKQDVRQLFFFQSTEHMMQVSDNKTTLNAIETTPVTPTAAQE
ncbi:MAG: DUF5711 family protein [Clostridiales bacterium]|jgi:hypothetical protein|nr:DUF5711 family protein [Clostridiales bacterium]